METHGVWFEPRAGAARCGTPPPLPDAGKQSLAPALPPTTRAGLRASLCSWVSGVSSVESGFGLSAVSLAPPVPSPKCLIFSRHSQPTVFWRHRLHVRRWQKSGTVRIRLKEPFYSTPGERGTIIFSRSFRTRDVTRSWGSSDSAWTRCSFWDPIDCPVSTDLC